MRWKVYAIFIFIVHFLEDTHQDIIAELEDGLAGSMTCDVLDENSGFIRGGVDPKEKSAVEGLLALCNVTEEWILFYSENNTSWLWILRIYIYLD